MIEFTGGSKIALAVLDFLNILLAFPLADCLVRDLAWNKGIKLVNIVRVGRKAGANRYSELALTPSALMRVRKTIKRGNSSCMHQYRIIFPPILLISRIIEV